MELYRKQTFYQTFEFLLSVYCFAVCFSSLGYLPRVGCDALLGITIITLISLKNLCRNICIQELLNSFDCASGLD